MNCWPAFAAEARGRRRQRQREKHLQQRFTGSQGCSSEFVAPCDAPGRCCGDDVHVDELPVAVGHSKAAAGLDVGLVLRVAPQVFGRVHRRARPRGRHAGRTCYAHLVPTVCSRAKAAPSPLAVKPPISPSGRSTPRPSPGSVCGLAVKARKCQLGGCGRAAPSRCDRARPRAQERLDGLQGQSRACTRAPRGRGASATAPSATSSSASSRGGASPTSGVKLTACSESQVDSIVDCASYYWPPEPLRPQHRLRSGRGDADELQRTTEGVLQRRERRLT